LGRWLSAAGIAFLCLGSPEKLHALDPTKSLTQYGHESWQSEDGLPKGAVWGLLQSRDGYLWVATEGGLARFDGVRFTTFLPSEREAAPGPFYSRLFEDRDGTLWVLSMGDGLWRYRDGKFTTFTAQEGLTSDHVVAMCQTKDGTLWIATRGAGLLRYRDGAFLAPFTKRDGLTGDSLRCLLLDRSGTLWASAEGGGLNRIRDGKVSVLGVKEGLASDTVNCLMEDHFGNLWVGTSAGLDRCRDGQVRHYTTRDGLTADLILSLYEDRHGQVWVGTYGGGLNRIYGDQISALTTKEGLSNDLVFTLSEDREGSLWIGTSGGLDRLKDGKVTVYTTREGLSDDLVWCTTPGRGGALWVGTQNGLNRFEGGRIQRFLKADGLQDELVWSVLEDPSGTLWVGTKGGLLRYDGKAFKRYTTADGLSNLAVEALALLRDGTLLVGTDGGGLDKMLGGRLVPVIPKGELSSGTVMHIHEDRLGRVLVCTRGKLDILEGGRVTHMPFQALCVHEDTDGTLWMGTYGRGLCRMRGDRTEFITTKQGLFDDVILAIVDDGDGNLWMSSNRGLGLARRADLEAVAAGASPSLQCTTLGKADGMRSIICTGGCQPTACRTPDGRLWFGTMKGLVGVDPRHLTFNEVPPPVAVEEVRVGQKAVPFAGGLELGPDAGEVEVRYTALSLLVPQRVQFKIRMEGYDRDWVPVGPERIARYGRLPPGTYRFQVIACNNDGVWNNAGASFPIVLRPHFYATWWFRTLAVLGLLAAVYGLFLLRLRQLHQREDRLLLLVGQRTAELEDAKSALEERSRQLEEANKMLIELSYKDSLTGVANRRHFEEILDSEWRRAVRSRAPLGLLMGDIDFFKAYNDTCGHPAGDDCLRRIAGAMQEGVRRAGETLARYGGEEFAIIVPDVTLEQAAAFAEDLRLRVEALSIQHPASGVHEVVTISLGAASLVPRDGILPANLLAAADGALYRAKQRGRNRVESGTP
jgi:diguanylate cyclase (GGDEF)-like protein